MPRYKQVCSKCDWSSFDSKRFYANCPECGSPKMSYAHADFGDLRVRWHGDSGAFEFMDRASGATLKTAYEDAQELIVFLSKSFWKVRDA